MDHCRFSRHGNGPWPMDHGPWTIAVFHVRPPWSADRSRRVESAREPRLAPWRVPVDEPVARRPGRRPGGARLEGRLGALLRELLAAALRLAPAHGDALAGGPRHASGLLRRRARREAPRDLGREARAPADV